MISIGFEKIQQNPGNTEGFTHLGLYAFSGKDLRRPTPSSPGADLEAMCKQEVMAKAELSAAWLSQVPQHAHRVLWQSLGDFLFPGICKTLFSIIS